MSTAPPVALTIAGSDPAGGAGIQADLKTFHQHGVYGAAVISLLTVQNTVSLRSVHVQPAELVEQQLSAVLEDLPIAACKTGALGDAAVVEAVAETLGRCDAPLVVDPVMISKAGAALLQDDALSALSRTLLPRATLVTPNLDEARRLSGRTIDTRGEGARDAARAIADLGCPGVLIKGGHRADAPTDLLLWEGHFHELAGVRVETRHTHGVGCTLSAAVCARLSQGHSVVEACRLAKRWLSAAIASAPGLGAGQGAVDHLAPVPPAAEDDRKST